MNKFEDIELKRRELSKQQTEIVKDEANKQSKITKGLEKLRQEEFDLVKKFETKVFNKFKGIHINLTNNAQCIKIKLGDTFILEHLYNDSSFENIDKSLYKEIVKLYEDLYGEPQEIGKGITNFWEDSYAYTLSTLGNLGGLSPLRFGDSTTV